MKRVSFVLLCLAASLPAADVGGSDVIQELQKYYFSVPQNSPARYFANSAANFAPHDIFRVRYGIEADGRSVAQAQHSLLLLRDKIRRGMAWQTPVLKVVLPRVADSVTVNPEDADSLLKSLLAMKGDFLTGKDVLAPVHAETRWYAGYSEKYLFFSVEYSDSTLMLKEKNEIFRGDSLEIFISTYPNPLYREIIVNPRRDQFDAWHVTNPFGGFVTPKRRYEAPEIITIVRRQSDEFRLIVAVPWRLLPEYTRGGGPRSGERITFMLVRSDGAPGRETLYYSCYPLLGDGHNLNMHIQATLE